MQTENTAPAAADKEPVGFFESLAAEPALLELLVVGFVFLLFLLLYRRAGRIAEMARGRAALGDYLLGAEQALAGDLKGAAKRLGRVLREAPDNQEARLLYGEVLSAQGESAKAHKHHVELKRAFQLKSPRNDLGQAQSLLRTGHARDAVESATAAAEAMPESVEAWRFLHQAQLQVGLAEDAATSGERLARLLPPGEERDATRRAAAMALCRAAESQLQSAKLGRARELQQRAARLLPTDAAVQLLADRITVHQGGPEAVRNLIAPVTEGDNLPVAAAPNLPQISQPPSQVAVNMATQLQKWPYRCKACLTPVREVVQVCPHCGQSGSVGAIESHLHQPLESAALAMDEVEENAAHVRRLIEGLIGADAVLRKRAHEQLLDLGEGAVESVLEAGVRDQQVQGPVIAVLQDMGPRILPALFAAYENLKERRLLGIPGLRVFRSPSDVVRRVVQGYGPEAADYLERLLPTEDRDLRKVLIDYYLSLGDQGQFAKLLDRYPPVEIVHRLNDADAEMLRPLLATTQRGSFLAEGLLASAVFHRDLDLLEAIVLAEDGSLLESIIERRGYNRTITRALIDRLDDETLGPSAGRVLSAFGFEAVDQMVAEFADLDLRPTLREDLAVRIAACGARVVERICDCIGPAPSDLDEELLALLGRIGAPALTPLTEAFKRGSLLEKFGGSLVRRYTHRRRVLLRAMQRIGGAQAIQTLTRLLDAETDQDLQLLIQRALHELSDSHDEDQSRPQAEEDNRGAG